MSALELAREVNELTTFPDIAFEISDLLDDENSSAWDIGALIEQDPALSAALLRIANSALYNNGVPVGAIDRAVTVVGAREVRDLAFGVCTSTACRQFPNRIVRLSDFWRHSLFCAAATRSLGESLNIRCRESLFLAGLLHDVGQLAMYSQRPELSQNALLLALEESDGRDTTAAEQAVFGFDHTEVGAELMALWDLPAYLQHVTRNHHNPTGDSVITDLVHVANSIAVLAEVDSTDINDAPPIAPQVSSRLSLDSDLIWSVAGAAQEVISDLMQAFGGNQQAA